MIKGSTFRRLRLISTTFLFVDVGRNPTSECIAELKASETPRECILLSYFET